MSTEISSLHVILSNVMYILAHFIPESVFRPSAKSGFVMNSFLQLIKTRSPVKNNDGLCYVRQIFNPQLGFNCEIRPVITSMYTV